MALNPYMFPVNTGPESPASAAQDNAPTQYKGNPRGANNMPRGPRIPMPIRPSQPDVMPVQGQRPQSNLQPYDWRQSNSGSQAPGYGMGPYNQQGNPVKPGMGAPTLFDLQRDYNKPRGQMQPATPGMTMGGVNGRRINPFQPNPGGYQGGGYEDMIRQMMERFGMNSGGYQGGNANYFGGQAQNVGRYRPPTMSQGGQWEDTQPYNYNLPNAFGSYPGYGQGNPNSRNYGYGYEGMYGPQPPIPGGG